MIQGKNLRTYSVRSIQTHPQAGSSRSWNVAGLSSQSNFFQISYRKPSLLGRSPSAQVARIPSRETFLQSSEPFLNGALHREKSGGKVTANARRGSYFHLHVILH